MLSVSVSENIKIKRYSDLKAWRNGIELVKDVYSITKLFPVNQQYGLKSQLERAAISVPSNIAEGSGRNGTQEFIYHLGIAQGSLYEVETQLVIAFEIGFINQETLDKLFNNTNEIGRMINGLIAKLKQKNTYT